MKKKLLAVAVAMFMATAPLCISAHAEENTPVPEESQESTQTESRVEDLYTFSINTAGRAEIYDFKPSETYEGELIIPSELDGCPVGYIGNAAFMNAKGITSITIPASVTDMGNSVFFGCTSLEKISVASGSSYFTVTDGVLFADNNQFLVAYPANKSGESYQIPDTVDEIAQGCFGFAQNLKQITIPSHVNYIDMWAFAYSNLEKVVIASMQLDDYAFAYCEKLHDIELQAGVETIYDATFSNCSALEQITLPNTLTYVGQYAFSGTSMHSVTIPSSVNEIDYCAFGYNADLNQINDFVIYGEAGTAAQTYCTEEDTENDYKNDFTFIEINNADEPQEIATGEQDNAENIENTEIETNSQSNENDENEEDIPAEIAETNIADILGPEVKNNQFLRILLATVGGIAIILAIALIVLLVKKPKHKKTVEDDEDEEE
ncbi:MAG: leucine-rich repeat domain-containing protein [Oscillospiraceae bacterium]|nr:leucine-rich repeat domain-containing protein [Oscillospiraceae bacterium]